MFIPVNNMQDLLKLEKAINKIGYPESCKQIDEYIDSHKGNILDIKG